MIYRFIKTVETSESKARTLLSLWPALLGLGLWIGAGTLFYFLVANCTALDTDYSACPSERPGRACGWTLAQSFYYSVQAGLSIGFGLLAEDKDISRLYSVLHILAGSSVIAGALAIFVSLGVERNSSFLSGQERRLAGFANAIGTNGYKGLRPGELTELMLQFPQYLRDLYMQMYSDDEAVAAKMRQFDAAGGSQKRLQVIEAIQEGHEKVAELGDDSVTIDELRELHARQRSALKRVYHYLKDQRGHVSMVGAFAAWVCVGVAYGVFVERWSFLQSLHFTVGALSTAGLQAVTPCNGGFNVTFAAVFGLTGVPIYACTLGSHANLLVDQYNRSVFEEKTRRRVTDSEVAFVESLLDREHSDEIDLAEYLGIQLMRLGKVDRGDLQEIKDRFLRLDGDKTGRIRREDFMASLGSLERQSTINKLIRGREAAGEEVFRV